jgi:ABC-type amino acid transport substrate-binding protein
MRRTLLRKIAAALAAAAAVASAAAQPAEAPAPAGSAAPATSAAQARSAAPPAGRLERVRAAGTLRVCIWPEYYGITFRNPKSGELSGIDETLSREFAKELGVRPVYVDSSFTTFVQDLLADRCDVAMFGVGMLPERAARVRFTQPYLRSDIWAVTTRTHPSIRTWDDIDRPGRVVAVQAGTFMEPVMRETLRHAEVLSVKLPATREREVQAGRADVFMTDYAYSRRVLDNADWARVMAPERPVHPLGYAYAVAPGDDAWLARVDRFVADVKRDGRLLAAARAFKLEPIVVTQ